MVTILDRKDAPSSRRVGDSPRRAFARDALEEFLRISKEGDVAEVTGMPRLCDDERANADKVRQAVNAERHLSARGDEVKAFRRGGRLFLERVAPFDEQVRRIRERG